MFKGVGDLVAVVFELGVVVFIPFGKFGVVIDFGEDKLWEAGGTDFHQNTFFDAITVFAEVFVEVDVMEFNPTAAAAGPRYVFRGAAENDQRHAIVRDFGDLGVFEAVIDHAKVNFVGHDEEVVFFGQFHDFFDCFAAVNGAGRVVGIDDQNAGDTFVIFNLFF